MTTDYAQKLRSAETVKTTHRALVEDLMMAALDSIPQDKKNPKTFWSQAQKALGVGARRSNNPQQFIQELARILQLEGWRKAHDNLVSSVISTIEAQQAWPQIRQLIMDEEAYLIVSVRVRREQRATPYQFTTPPDEDQNHE